MSYSPQLCDTWQYSVPPSYLFTSFIVAKKPAKIGTEPVPDFGPGLFHISTGHKHCQRSHKAKGLGHTNEHKLMARKFQMKRRNFPYAVTEY